MLLLNISVVAVFIKRIASKTTTDPVAVLSTRSLNIIPHFEPAGRFIVAMAENRSGLNV